MCSRHQQILETPLWHSTAEVTSGDNALKDGTLSVMQFSLQNFSHEFLLCLSEPSKNPFSCPNKSTIASADLENMGKLALSTTQIRQLLRCYHPLLSFSFC
jgi:hypothetical protein